MTRPNLVAHRGQPTAFPENSLEGYQHVLQAGIEYIETDIHFTDDEIPVLSHDEDLLLLTGQALTLVDHRYQNIQHLSAGHADRFGTRFADCRIASLQQFVDLMLQWPKATCFIELKTPHNDTLGTRAIDLVCDVLAPIAAQCVLISFEYTLLAYAKQHHNYPIGWVLPEWSKQNQHKATRLAPDYLFVDVNFCPTEAVQFWLGDWKWAAYTVNTAMQYHALAAMGIPLIETDRYSELIHEL